MSASISNCGVWGASPSIVVAPSLLGDTAENGAKAWVMIGQLLTEFFRKMTESFRE
ncbi:hypothetical protein JK202_11095 [Gluconobacter sp. Dm-62]|uniref:hypothetical protein n=1 Tax=Gluconobacter sp. Dm-62 TaxID=2799804 RepID=UPI001B8ACD89|nr:hypothetical protein [Gluconobacter sp. Dm-62]MBS1103555.1 hypothetical protein [Gluconobacter sp. Dm-62]